MVREEGGRGMSVVREEGGRGGWERRVGEGCECDEGGG